MAKYADSWTKPVCKYIRHRKIGNFELYIYKCAGHYVLDEREGQKRGHNITYDTSLDCVLLTYNRVIREAQLYK